MQYSTILVRRLFLSCVVLLVAQICSVEFLWIRTREKIVSLEGEGSGQDNNTSYPI